MPNLIKKIVTSLLLSALIVPTAFLSLPKKVEAQSGGLAACVAGYAAALIPALASAPQDVIGVPVSQFGRTAQDSLTGGSANALSFNNCVLRPLGKIIVITLIRNIGSSVVN